VNPAEKFLLILASVAVIGCVIINVLFGPPGLSRAYLSDHKADHDRYLKITKSPAYKLYEERPLLNIPDNPDAANPVASIDVAYVEDYRQRAPFKAELSRIGTYGLLFDFFNAALLIVLVWRFGRKPILNLLDDKIEQLREKLTHTESEREEAEDRRHLAEAQLELLHHDQERIDDETKQQLKHDLEAMQEGNKKNFVLLERERKDRIQEEELAAKQALKRELVEQAITRITARYESNTAADANTDHQADLIEQFVHELEPKS
jgi:F0F1-type ATP synthase membrane subunit b/b'